MLSSIKEYNAPSFMGEHKTKQVTAKLVASAAVGAGIGAVIGGFKSVKQDDFVDETIKYSAENSYKLEKLSWSKFQAKIKNQIKNLDSGITQKATQTYFAKTNKKIAIKTDDVDKIRMKMDNIEDSDPARYLYLQKQENKISNELISLIERKNVLSARLEQIANGAVKSALEVQLKNVSGEVSKLGKVNMKKFAKNELKRIRTENAEFGNPGLEPLKKFFHVVKTKSAELSKEQRDFASLMIKRVKQSNILKEAKWCTLFSTIGCIGAMLINNKLNKN